MTPDLIAAVRATVEAMQNAEDGPWIATFFRSPRGARQSWCIGSPNGSQQIAGRVHDGETAHAIATVGNLIIQNGPAILAALERLEKLEAGAEESVAGKRRDAEHRADVDLNHGLRARLERVERALHEYGEHLNGCIRLRFEGGRPTDSGGYEMRYAGEWYETKPTDRTPACTCGWDEAIGEAVKP